MLTPTPMAPDDTSMISIFWLRRSASTSAAIEGTLRHGTKVTVLETASDGWSRIRSGSLTGYVKSAYLVSAEPLPTVKPEATKAPEQDEAAGVATITLRSSSSKLNVRKEATTSSAIAGTLKHGVQVEVLGESGEWSRIRSGSLTGYVMTTYLSKSVEAKPTEPPAENSKYETLSYGDSGTAFKRLQARLKELGYFNGELGGNYLKLTRAAVEAYQQANGWQVDGVASPELQKEIFEETNSVLANATVSVGENSYLNLREKADSDSTVLARMKNGTRVRVTGSDGGWYQVETANGTTGYAKKDYIRQD